MDGLILPRPLVLPRGERLRLPGAVPTLDGSGWLLMPDFLKPPTVAGTAVSLLGHGAADHGDLTRSLWLDTRLLITLDGTSTASTGGTAPDAYTMYNLPDAATSGSYGEFLMPTDAKAAQPISAAIYWIAGSADAVAHTVRWSFDCLAAVAGTDFGAAGTTTNFTGSSAARTVGPLVIEAAQQVLASVSANDLIRMNVRRVGADAADTYVGAVKFLGVRLDYAAVE